MNIEFGQGVFFGVSIGLILGLFFSWWYYYIFIKDPLNSTLHIQQRNMYPEARSSSERPEGAEVEQP